MTRLIDKFYKVEKDHKDEEEQAIKDILNIDTSNIDSLLKEKQSVLKSKKTRLTKKQKHDIVNEIANTIEELHSVVEPTTKEIDKIINENIKNNKATIIK